MVNKANSRSSFVERASDWNCINLVDYHRSPVRACSKTWSGSPVGIRTCYRLVTSGEISTLFSARRSFASVHSDTMKAPFASAKLRRKGTKSAAYFSHIFVHAARNACSGLAAVIGPACRQVNDISPFWSARFGWRRFRCFLRLEVTQEQLRKRELHAGSVSDRNHHFLMQ